MESTQMLYQGFWAGFGAGFLLLSGLRVTEVCISKDDPPIMKISILALYSLYC